MRTRTRPLVALFSLLLVAGAASCGSSGSDGASDAGSEGGPFSEITDEGAGGDGATDGGSDEGSSGPAGVKVTVGDETFEATNEVTCIAMAGALNAQFLNDDETVSIDVSLPPENWESEPGMEWEPPGIRVDDDRDEADLDQWVAGSAELDTTVGGDARISSVESFSIDGNTASGEATFIDNYVLTTPDTPTTVSGSFEITCS